MSIKSICSECGQKIAHGSDVIGVKIDCPTCGRETWLTGTPVPKPTPKPAAPPKPAPVIDRSWQACVSAIGYPLGLAIILTFSPALLALFGWLFLLVDEKVAEIIGASLAGVAIFVSFFALVVWTHVGFAIRRVAINLK